ncbi:MAG: histidine kinase [Cyclobacteriaceae bacterium]
MKNIKIKEVYVRWFGIPLVALLSVFSIEHARQGVFWREYLIGLSFTTLYWNGAFLIFMMYRRLYPNISETTKRLTITIISLVIWLTFGGLPLKLVFGYMELRHIFNMESYLETLPFNMMIGFFVGSLYEGAFFFEKYKETFRINEQLKNQQIRTQLEVLQNQMSPHFLFNSLNTLTTLIAESQEVAIDFTQNLSEVYRYILKNKDRELVRLEEEIDFAKSYVFLLKMRYPDNLTVDFNVPDVFLSTNIAPLTIQMLLENAIKHNIVSKSKPLHIDVYIENGRSIVVKNNLQLKSALEKSTKTGLTNIKNRYAYFGNKQIDIISTTRNFMVAVPLIDLIEDNQLSIT